ncbi:MAG: hypothetical protein RL189_2835 [Pseudomonadota bacterium]
MNLFTQSPIEASLWTSFVGMQDWIVDALLLTPVFKAAVATWMGYVLIRSLMQLGSAGRPSSTVVRLVMSLVLSGLGFAILNSRSAATFRPVNAAAGSWTNSTRVKATGKYANLSAGSARGLSVYVQIHRGVNQIAEYASAKVGEMFRNPMSTQSPYLMIQTLAQTAGSTIDDPKSLSTLNWLFENCADGRQAKLVGVQDSYAGLFDGTKPDCRERQQQLKAELYAWAQGKWGTSWWNAGQIALGQLQTKLGFMDEDTLRNKMIASAVVNTARAQMGQNKQNVNTGALLGKAGSDPQAEFGAAYFASASNLFSVAGLMNSLFKPLTGTDMWAADARNQSAAAYNRILQFMPPIRGYAKGMLALTFVFAAASLCFGSARYMLAWFGMLFVYSAYGPLSTLLYETTMMFTQAKETTDALGALRNDPLVLSGAAIVDDNIARIQSVYFGLQMGLATLCGVGGMSIFVFAKRMGHGLGDSLLGKAVGALHTVTFIRNATSSPKGVEHG